MNFDNEGARFEKLHVVWFPLIWHSVKGKTIGLENRKMIEIGDGGLFYKGDMGNFKMIEIISHCIGVMNTWLYIHQNTQNCSSQRGNFNVCQF